jgi:hypothetical protein
MQRRLADLLQCRWGEIDPAKYKFITGKTTDAALMLTILGQTGTILGSACFARSTYYVLLAEMIWRYISVAVAIEADLEYQEFREFDDDLKSSNARVDAGAHLHPDNPHFL